MKATQWVVFADAKTQNAVKLEVRILIMLPCSMAIQRQLDKADRRAFAEKLMEWGNLVFVGLVIGQLVPGTEAFRLSLVLVGFVCIFAAYALAIFFMKQEVKQKQ